MIWRFGSESLRVVCLTGFASGKTFNDKSKFNNPNIYIIIKYLILLFNFYTVKFDY